MWLAHDEVLDAPVAVKVLAGGLIDDLDVRNRFLGEARILRRADSERLVRVHDIGELDDGRPYFVMSYADRGTLAERMKGRELPVDEALRLAIEISRGVEVINRLGIIHRDLKPSNILFQSTADGGERLLIADLGLAKALAHASGAFTLPVGTPGYMSPEQARFGGGLDVRADVYGLGALAYHLLTGRAPGPAPVQVPPSARRPGLPQIVDDIVMRALESDRERRWPSAEAFAAALSVPLMSAGDDATLHDPPRNDPTVHDATVHDADRPAGTDTVLDAGGPAGGDTVLDAGGARGTGEERPTGTGAASGSGGGAPRDETLRVPVIPDDDTGPGASAPRDETLRVPVIPDDDTGPYANPADATIRTPPPPEATGEPIVVDLSAGRARGRRRDDAGPGGRPRSPSGRGGPAVSGGPAISGTKPSKRGRLVVIATLAAVLVAGGGGAYVIGRLVGGSPSKKPSDGWVTVTDVTGRLSVRVPPTWTLRRDHTTWPIPVTDRATAPALRATPDYDRFVRDDVPTPGLFAGLTHDMNATLPPPGLGRHRATCTEGPSEPYRHGTLSGRIAPWHCPGSITISEVGLRDSGGRFAMWVRVKLVGGPDVTKKILDSIRTKG